MIDSIKKDFTLSEGWHKTEKRPNGTYYKWSSAESSILINNSENYTFLKIKIQNECSFVQNRKIKIYLDNTFFKELTFYDINVALDIKIPIKNVNKITFSTDQIYVPQKYIVSDDFRELGFTFSNLWIDTISEENVNVNINDFENVSIKEYDNEIFIDQSSYNFNVCKLNPTKSTPNIFYIGQYGTSGYATAAKGYIYRYVMNNYGITWYPLHFDDSVLSDDCPYNVVAKSVINKKLSDYNVYIYHTTPDLWKGFNETLKSVIQNNKKIGYTVWETSKLPVEHVENINSNVDEVWCPSNYNKEVFESSGVTIPIKVIPHVFLKKPLFDKKLIKIYDTAGNLIENTDDYTFYSIGEFNERKGIEDLINCFCQTFTKKDKVRLLVKTHYKDYSNKNKQYCLDKIRSILNTYTDIPHIYYFIDNMTENDIIGLHSLGDCYVSLTKSEGFGLTIFDAFNYGKKIIATGYSGHLDYLGKNYNGLVRYKLDTVKNMEDFSRFYSEDTIWAYPDLTHAKELMRGMIKL
jgi:glycosyltransferase involved in cell wall biosynthesis